MPTSNRQVDTLPALLAETSRTSPEATALWWQGEATSYRELYGRVQQLAARLCSMGRPGDRVAVLAWNCPAFVELIYAVPASGQILVPLNARLAPAEWLYQLRSAGVTTLFAEPGLLDSLRQHPDFPGAINCLVIGPEYEDLLASEASGDAHTLPRLAADDPVWILYTSGTTGKPKGAILSHRSFLAGLESAALGRPVQPEDRYFYPFPLFHVAAHNVLLQHRFGAAVVLSKAFDPAETLRSARELRVTTMSLAPTMIAMLLDHPEFNCADLASVRTIGYGASAMPLTLLRKLFEELDVGLCQSYGMTELSGSIAFLTVADHRLAASRQPELLASVGKPLATAVVKIVDEQGRQCEAGSSGEILVRAAQCMLGYWQQPEATAATLVDGWLHTGDIGRFDSSGYLYLVDRKKDMIITGGENVASREVEEALRAHPAVKDCAVIGIPDPTWGESICAVLVVSRQVPDEELASHCRGLLAGYKLPRHWRRLESLPVNAAGKIDKTALRRDTSQPPAG